MQVHVIARIAAVGLFGLAYMVASHWLMTQTRESAWNVVGVLSPMLLIVAIGAWRSGYRLVGAGAALVIAGLCVLAAMGVKAQAHLLYLVQHAGFNLFLAIVFGSTLRRGHTALITMLATRVHGHELMPTHLAYTRKLTGAWTVFFVVIVVISLALYAFANFDTWAVFANIVTPIATVLMFGVEHVVRYRLHPEFERASMSDAIRAYMMGTKPPAPSARP
jgi:uncharacterized membrane protein